jgi:hypothetical protein
MNAITLLEFLKQNVVNSFILNNVLNFYNSSVDEKEILKFFSNLQYNSDNFTFYIEWNSGAEEYIADLNFDTNEYEIVSYHPENPTKTKNAQMPKFYNLDGFLHFCFQNDIPLKFSSYSIYNLFN